MKRTLKSIGDIFGAPSEAFAEIKKQPNWGTVFVITALVSIGIAWAISPFSQQISHVKILESGLDEAQIERTRGMTERFSCVWPLLTPVTLLIKWLVFAGLLYLGAHLLGGRRDMKFKPMLAVVSHTEIILVFSNLINAAVLLCFKDVSDIRESIDRDALPTPQGVGFLKKIRFPQADGQRFVPYRNSRGMRSARVTTNRSDVGIMQLPTGRTTHPTTGSVLLRELPDTRLPN